MVGAHPELAGVGQANFHALMVPAASIAVWILQHAPHLARLASLDIVVAEAIEFQALDSGRWLQFIPWLLGRPGMRIEATLVGRGLLAAIRASEQGAALKPADIEQKLRSHSWTAVRGLAPARLVDGTVAAWRAASDAAPALPDLCVVFTPDFAQHYDALLGEDGLLPLVRAGVPLALFSPSETEQLLDLYALNAAGLHPTDAECWPNPWALPARDAERTSVYGKMGWAATFDSVPDHPSPDNASMLELAGALQYLGSIATAGGPDALLGLGESLGTAPRDASEDDRGNPLLRLPFGVAVDASNGHVYQLQDATALLLDAIPPVPSSVLASFPGDENLLRRAMWTVSVHREHVAPFAQLVDEALRSEFGRLT
jgi:hypothetical protein